MRQSLEKKQKSLSGFQKSNRNINLTTFLLIRGYDFMKEGNTYKLDMKSELFISSRKNTEFWIPPKSKEDYLRSLETEISADEKIKFLTALVEIYRLETRGNDGQYSEAVCGEMISILHKHGLNPDLSERAACMLIKEGGYCEKVGDYPNALRFYESSLPFEIKDPIFRYFRLNNLAFCLNFFSRFEEAEKYLRQAVDISPERYNAWKNLGVSLEHQSQIEEAAECYLRAIALSGGEHRSVTHLKRLMGRYPFLTKISALKDFK